MPRCMLVGTALLLGCGLAIDSAAVALAFGVQRRDHRVSEALGIGLSFGLVHGALTYIGWFAGAQVAGWFQAIDHWVAFAVLAALGVKSIFEARGEEGPPRNLTVAAVAAAAVATSLDGVSVGFGLALTDEPVALVAISAATATAIGAATCYLVGRWTPVAGRRAAHVVAGLILIGIGASILREHLA